jgi:hypothetical protein
MQTKYIHYGHKTFDKSKFKPILNMLGFTKPSGGLWASPIDSELGWKDWCESEDFRECKEEDSFTFTLKENSNILHIYSLEDLRNLPKMILDIKMFTVLDFEKIKDSGVDGIELHLYSEHYHDLYNSLYGWDCDSILIMNPDIIEIKKEEGEK